MPPISREQIESALESVKYPGFSRNIVSFGLIKEIAVDGSAVSVRVEHGIDDLETLRQLEGDIRGALKALDGVGEVDLQLRGKAPAAASSTPAPAGPDPVAQEGPLSAVRHVVAVASAKGGVGKSTVATNLALALSQRGHKVGLMDADIYGPSLPTMLGVNERPHVTEDRKIHPIDKDGLKLMSIGFLVPSDKALIWRGPMVMGAVQQFLGDVLWGDLDILVVDLPPGTGDAQLTLVQQVPLSGVVMVTTPQDVALIDVVRGIQMFQETQVPIIGVVENMSAFHCPQCGHESEIFGKGGGERTSKLQGVPFLGAVPIEPAVRESGDQGHPVVMSHPQSASAQAFLGVAEGVDGFLRSKAGSTV